MIAMYLMCSVGDPSETLLQQVTRSRRSSSGDEEEGEGDDDVQGEEKERKLRYYLKVMTLFEQVSCPLSVVSIAETAVTHADKDDPLSVSSLPHFLCICCVFMPLTCSIVK